jgi:hypothetical protein
LSREIGPGPRSRCRFGSVKPLGLQPSAEQREPGRPKSSGVRPATATATCAAAAGLHLGVSSRGATQVPGAHSYPRARCGTGQSGQLYLSQRVSASKRSTHPQHCIIASRCEGPKPGPTGAEMLGADAAPMSASNSSERKSVMETSAPRELALRIVPHGLAAVCAAQHSALDRQPTTSG